MLELYLHARLIPNIRQPRNPAAVETDKDISVGDVRTSKVYEEQNCNCRAGQTCGKCKPYAWKGNFAFWSFIS
jgi:hypothetical protein